MCFDSRRAGSLASAPGSDVAYGMRALKARLAFALISAVVLCLPGVAQARKVFNPTDRLSATASAATIDIRKGFGHEQSSSLGPVKAPIFSGGVIAADGSFAVPAANVSYPAFALPDFSGSYTGCASCVTVDYRLTKMSLQIVPVGDVTGKLDPFTGSVTADWHVYVRVHYHLDVSYAGLLHGQYEQSDCTIGTAVSPIDVVMATGRTAPPAGTPNVPIKGVPYDEAKGTVGLVDNTFALPQSSADCNPKLGLFTFSLDNYLGLPSPSGYNALSLSLGLQPVIRRGVIAELVASKQQGSAPLSVRFDASGSQAPAGVARYEFDFNGDGVVDQSSSSPIGHFTFTRPGVYNPRVTVVDRDGDSDTATTTVSVGSTVPVSVTAGGKVKLLRRRGSIVVVTGQFVHCPAGPAACGVEVAVTTRAGAAHSARTVTIASERLRIPAGSKRVISFRLTRAGTALLHRLQRLPIRAIAVGTHGVAKPVRIVMILTLVDPRRPRQPPSGGSSAGRGHHPHRRRHR